MALQQCTDKHGESALNVANNQSKGSISKVWKRRLSLLNTQLPMAYCAVITQHPPPSFMSIVLFTCQLHLRLTFSQATAVFSIVGCVVFL